MKSKIFSILFALVLMASLGFVGIVANPAEQDNPASDPDILRACTSMTAGKDATVDGYTMSGHTCDGNCDWRLEVIPAATHDEGEFIVIDYEGMPGGFGHDALGETVIPQVAETYKWFNCECPLGNEFQVFIGENTCGTRSELSNIDRDDALLDWTSVAALGLQRGKTAREVILAMGALVEAHGLKGGFGTSGESYLISDPSEAWVLEIAGNSLEWVAQRVPDGHVCFHANRMRIQEIDLEDSDNFLASPNLITLAEERGFYDPEEGPFNFYEVYSGNTGMYNILREWRMVSLLCPSVEWDPEAIVYPFSVEPDEPISVEWWINNVWRDSYEGTPYDMTQGNAAGPFGSPVRQSIKGVSTVRVLATQKTSYSWVSQSRSLLPDSIGGVFWYSMDSGRSSTYVPFYVGITQTPESWRTGDFTEFSWDSAWWGFQAIDTLSQIRYRDINADVREVFDDLEQELFEAQAGIEQQASALTPSEAEEFLTNYSCDCAEEAEVACEELFYSLLVKYKDGYPRNAIVSDEWVEWLAGYTFPPIVVPVSFTTTLLEDWNLLSTPIKLDADSDSLGQIFGLGDMGNIEVSYSWDGGQWAQVLTDYELLPLHAIYVKVSSGDSATAEFFPSGELSEPPSRELQRGLNLIGPAPALDEDVLEGVFLFRDMPMDQALVTIADAESGFKGYTMVVSPAHNQPGWAYALGGEIEGLVPFKGYWVVMENPDTLFGSSTTPTP